MENHYSSDMTHPATIEVRRKVAEGFAYLTAAALLWQEIEEIEDEIKDINSTHNIGIGYGLIAIGAVISFFLYGFDTSWHWPGFISLMGLVYISTKQLEAYVHGRRIIAIRDQLFDIEIKYSALLGAPAEKPPLAWLKKYIKNGSFDPYDEDFQKAWKSQTESIISWIVGSDDYTNHFTGEYYL